MIINFKTQNQLLDFLISQSKIKYQRFSGSLIRFNDDEYSVSEFLKFLMDLDIVQAKYTWRKEFDYENKLSDEKLIESGFVFNYRNFEMLYSNELVQNSIYPFRLLTINETADILGVTRQTVYNLLRENKIVSYQILSQQKVRFLDLMKYIQANKNDINQLKSGL